MLEILLFNEVRPSFTSIFELQTLVKTLIFSLWLRVQESNTNNRNNMLKDCVGKKSLFLHAFAFFSINCIKNILNYYQWYACNDAFR